MENPWLEFVKNLDDNNLVLEQEQEIIEKFNNSTNETYKVLTEIMPAPFMGNVLTSPIVLLTLNPVYDEKEEEKNYYNEYKLYWKNEIQHIHSVPELPLFCLEDKYVEYSDYWLKKFMSLISVSSKEKVAQNISIIQFFPYHTKKYKNIPKRLLKGYLESQDYNFELVKQAIERKAIIIILRSKKLWFEAIPDLDNERTRFTNSALNTIQSEKNLGGTFKEIVDILNKD